ncbi:MAG: hypothetical protein R2728_05835 [Chitinophagales bacterium]
MSNNKNNTIIAILILLLLLLGAGLGYMMFEKKKLKEEITTITAKNDTVERLHVELQAEYDRSLDQLDNLEGENASLDSLLSTKKQELQEAKTYIASILSKQNASAAELANARNLIAQLTNQRISLQNAVDSLKQANIGLERDNIALIQEKEIIKNSLDMVSAEASKLEIEKKDLEREKNIASILSAKNVEAKGVRYKGGNKEVDSKKANSTKKIKICFDLLENKIAKEGPTQIHLRIIGPDGATMTLESMGSGTFKSVEDGTVMQYTYEISPDYEKDGKSVCSYWDQNSAYGEGEYQVEVYQRGYKIGTTSFELK